MSNHKHQNGAIPSNANIAGHPIHPMVIAFPVAFLSAAPLTDLAYLFTEDIFWIRISFWLLAAGLATGLFAAIFGLIDFFSIKKVRSHRAAWVHFLGNAAALIITAGNLWPRLDHPTEFVLPWGVFLSIIVAALIGVTGWYGGELSYRHRIGVMGQGSHIE